MGSICARTAWRWSVYGKRRKGQGGTVSVLTTNINLPFITADQNGPKHLDVNITRAKFEELTADLVQMTIGPTKQALDDAGLTPEEIDKVILVGVHSYSRRAEAVKRSVEKGTLQGYQPGRVVSIGATIQAGVLAGEVKDVLLLDVTPAFPGDRDSRGVFTRLIRRNTTIPAKEPDLLDGGQIIRPAWKSRLTGEQAMAADNKTLGRFSLDGIPPRREGYRKSKSHLILA